MSLIDHGYQRGTPELVHMYERFHRAIMSENFPLSEGIAGLRSQAEDEIIRGEWAAKFSQCDDAIQTIRSVGYLIDESFHGRQLARLVSAEELKARLLVLQFRLQEANEKLLQFVKS